MHRHRRHARWCEESRRVDQGRPSKSVLSLAHIAKRANPALCLSVKRVVTTMIIVFMCRAETRKPDQLLAGSENFVFGSSMRNINFGLLVSSLHCVSNCGRMRSVDDIWIYDKMCDIVSITSAESMLVSSRDSSARQHVVDIE